ncbi:amino acid permease [Streptomyces sp. NPDC059740]|uniref:amino acid permease n=1 Tax=Streptomyces sp. NPDC059740 TaxID=3346926 RepID=UPI003651780B
MLHTDETGDEAVPKAPAGEFADSAGSGYARTLHKRQVRMIALGGAIGSGLLLGSAGRLHTMGPALVLVYAVCGVFAFFVVRAMGELVLHRPTSGSFVSYAREFIGEKAAFVGGWMYFMNAALGGIGDSTAAAQYVHYWGMFDVVPQWLLALVALTLVLGVNLIAVRVFGEMEFWFSMVKVATLTAFLVIGVVVLASRHPVGGHTTGLEVITGHGGFFPHGVLLAVMGMQGVVFAYAGLETVGIAAGETADARAVVPKAINSMLWRIGVFYVGSVAVLALMLPSGLFHDGESPFVTVMSRLGVPWAGGVMDFVVLTAALSSLNSGLYTSARVLRAMGVAGSAPRLTTRMSRHRTPVGGIALAVGVNLLGVLLNYLWPTRAFDIVLNFSSLGIIATWAIIMICQILFRRKVDRGAAAPSSFPLMGAPFTSYLTLAFLLAVLVLLACSPDATDRWTTLGIPVLAIALSAGWFCVRGRVRRLATTARAGTPAGLDGPPAG